MPPACASIRPRAHGRARREPHLARGALGQPAAQRRAGLDHPRADPREALLGQAAQADGAEVALVPAPLVGEVGPLAGHRAGRAREAARRAPSQEVGEVEELPRGVEHLGPVLPEPQKLRGLHLGRDRAAHVAQDRVPGGIDALGLRHRAVVHPHDHVARGVLRRAHGQRRAALSQDDQRAGRVEAHPRDGGRIHARALHGLPDGPGRRPAKSRRSTARRWSRPSRKSAMSCWAEASIRPRRSKTPARALPVPTSTPTTWRLLILETHARRRDHDIANRHASLPRSA